MSSRRNGKIELLRFIFCICILFYHICKDLWDGKKLIADGFSFFDHGRTGVEFFFLITGFLAAGSAAKLIKQQSNISIGKSTYDFIFKKIKSIFIPHIILCTLMICLLAFNDKLTMKVFLNKFPSIFFLQATGITYDFFIAVEWYICSMLFALCIIYPLLLKNFEFTSNVIAPVGSSLLIGYMISKYNMLPSSPVPDPLISPNNLRGLAIVLLGVFCYSMCERIKSLKLKRNQKYFLVAAENICWIMSLYFIVSNVHKKYEGIVVYILAVAVTLAFSRKFDSKFYNNAFVMYLGRISLTVYLSQNLVRNFVRLNIKPSQDSGYVILVTFLSIAMGVIIDMLVREINTAIQKKNNC